MNTYRNLIEQIYLFMRRKTKKEKNKNNNNNKHIKQRNFLLMIIADIILTRKFDGVMWGNNMIGIIESTQKKRQKFLQIFMPLL